MAEFRCLVGRYEFKVEDNLTVVESDVQLRVNGFNSCQLYTTASYKVQIFIGNESYEIEAIGIPSIRTCLTLPGLSNVVKGFIDRGYTLADHFLLGGGGRNI